MTEQMRSELKELQRLDEMIENAEKRVAEFDPRFEEVEESALTLESEVGTTRGRVQEMRLEERRIEVMSQEKRTRVQKLEERLNQVRNVREEAAVSTELDLVRRALESDEQEALSLLDQIRRLETRLEEQEAALTEARAEVEPRRRELLEERDQALTDLDVARARRSEFQAGVDAGELRVYEAIRRGGRQQAVSSITEDGACGHCFSMVPLQVQNEIRHGNALIRCEGCGVILSAPSPDEIAAADAAAAAAADAPSDADADAAADAPSAADDEGAPGVGEGPAAAAEEATAEEPSKPAGDAAVDSAAPSADSDAAGEAAGPPTPVDSEGGAGEA